MRLSRPGGGLGSHEIDLPERKTAVRRTPEAEYPMWAGQKRLMATCAHMRAIGAIKRPVQEDRPLRGSQASTYLLGCRLIPVGARVLVSKETAQIPGCSEL